MNNSRNNAVSATLRVRNSFSVTVDGKYDMAVIDHITLPWKPSGDEVMDHLTCFHDFVLALPDHETLLVNTCAQAPTDEFDAVHKDPARVSARLTRGKIALVPTAEHHRDPEVYEAINNGIRRNIELLLHQGKQVKLHKEACIDIDHARRTVRVRINAPRRAVPFSLLSILGQGMGTSRG